MCTVSFISVKEKIIITSNRDEHIDRHKAYAPAFETLNNKKVIFPKDPKAGGTWFAAADNGNIAVLLNGGFVKHIPKPPYRKSRGLVLLDIIGADDPLDLYKETSLDNIEPFTTVLFQQGILYELRWDGEKKHKLELDSTGKYIWSSATLYSSDVINYRKHLFDKFINETGTVSPELVNRFHSHNNDDEENGFVINRKTGLKTFSITQAIHEQNNIHFLHSDLLDNKQFEETMTISHAMIH
jgi:uncharacterized protein with NRDE domain